MPFALNQIVYDAASGTTFPPIASQIAINNTPAQGTGYGAADDIEKAIYDNTTATYNFWAAAPYFRDSFDDQGTIIKSIAHWDNNSNNASWITGSATGHGYAKYGDGSGLNGPTGNSLDVVAHEFTHGVTGSESGLIYQGASGALNESISDIFGVMAGQRNDTDWLVAEDYVVPADLNVALRSMSNPTAFNQPDHMDDYATPDGGGSVYDQSCYNATNYDNDCVHINSGIPNKAAYLMAAGGSHHGVVVDPLDGAIAASRVMMGRIFHLANTTYLTNSSDFFAARIATEDAVKSLFPGDMDKLITVMYAWLAVGVSVPVSASESAYASSWVPGYNHRYRESLPQNIPFGADSLAMLSLLGCASYRLIRRPRANTPPAKSTKA